MPKVGANIRKADKNKRRKILEKPKKIEKKEKKYSLPSILLSPSPGPVQCCTSVPLMKTINDNDSENKKDSDNYKDSQKIDDNDN